VNWAGPPARRKAKQARSRQTIGFPRRDETMREWEEKKGRLSGGVFTKKKRGGPRGREKRGG